MTVSLRPATRRTSLTRAAIHAEAIAAGIHPKRARRAPLEDLRAVIAAAADLSRIELVEDVDAVDAPKLGIPLDPDTVAANADDWADDPEEAASTAIARAAMRGDVVQLPRGFGDGLAGGGWTPLDAA